MTTLRFNIDMTCDNEAFADDAGVEVARILHNVTIKFG